MKRINMTPPSRTRTTLTALAGVLMVTTLFFGFAVQSQAATSTIPLCEITRSLTVGTVGEDVWCLQRYLNWSGFTIAATGPGSPGNESHYFGVLTNAAVVRWQEANRTTVLSPVGLTQGSGFWGRMSFARYVEIVKTALGVS